MPGYREVLMRLLNFRWDGDQLDFAPGIVIKRFPEPPDLSLYARGISQQELERQDVGTHWLSLTWEEGSEPTSGAIANLFLFSLWIVRTTRTHIDFRFWHADGRTRFGSSRLLDRFSWIPDNVSDEYSTGDLAQASAIYAVLIEIYLRKGRLNDCLLMSISGCWSHYWQTALVCHAASIEAILTYSTGPGITRRLAMAYACLIEVDQAAREAAFREFSKLYNARSDIMHGRTFQIPLADRLAILDRLQLVLRQLISKVCSDAQLRAVLEDADDKRQAYFDAIQFGFTPPAA
jgi:hypothetical protein